MAPENLTISSGFAYKIIVRFLKCLNPSMRVSIRHTMTTSTVPMRYSTPFQPLTNLPEAQLARL